MGPASYGDVVGPNVELTGRLRQDARPEPATMYRVPPARAWWPAVGAPVERRVRRLSPACEVVLRQERLFAPSWLELNLPQQRAALLVVAHSPLHFSEDEPLSRRYVPELKVALRIALRLLEHRSVR